MAKVINPDKGQVFRTVARRVEWAKYADGQVWELTRYEDFDQTVLQAAAAFKKWAQRNDKSCQTRVVSDTVLRVQALPLTPVTT